MENRHLYQVYTSSHATSLYMTTTELRWKKKVSKDPWSLLL